MKTALLTLIAGASLLAGGPKSGPEVGGEVFAFDPHHVTGPDANTDTCPVCKYGNAPAVQVWIHGDSVENERKIVSALEAKASTNPKGLRAFVVNVIDVKDKSLAEANLKSLAKSTSAKKVALTYLTNDSPAVKDYEINLSKDVKNTVFVYRNRKVIAKWVNLVLDKQGTAALSAAVTKATK